MTLRDKLSIVADAVFSTLLIIGGLALGILFGWKFCSKIASSASSTHISPSNLYAEIISTNLVSVPCPCGFCKPDQGIAVPEHINQIGYDLKVVVSTSYYPIVIRPSDFR